jgi:hypothetical protein
MKLEYMICKTPPIVDCFIMNTRLDEDDNSLVLEYNNGETIRISLADLIGHEA